MQGANCTSGAIWGQYLAQGHFDTQLNLARGSWDSNQQPDDVLYSLAELLPTASML